MRLKNLRKETRPDLSHKILINKKKTITAEGEKSLLQILKENRIFLPSACAGRGACGMCRCKILSGPGELQPRELLLLSEGEKKQGVRLACQTHVTGDMEIMLPDEFLNAGQFLAEVVSLRNLTYDIKEVLLKLIDPGEIHFKAGQYIQIEVPPYELCEEGVYRAYSIASSPSCLGNVELEIRFVPNGICTTYVHQHLKTGDRITINGPHGSFFLRDTDADIIFIAGGSGMAPIKSMLLDMAERGIRRKAMYLFGARSKKDLFLVEEMQELEKRLSLFKFIPALSLPQPEDRWEGDTGLITDVLERHIGSAENPEAYLCGSPGMINACVKVLKKSCIPEDKIYYDRFA